jgi:uncharacterized Zn finger protein (UPF0148 family)
MSDFDKEAERERLREKYERDQQKREATEKMSELLLQGATMTNAHCSECNDPIFRYDGQEFCATYEKPVDRDTGSEDDEGVDGQDAIEVTSPSEDAQVKFGGDGTQATNGAESPDTADTPREQTSTGSQQPGGEPRDDTARQTDATRRQPATQAPQEPTRQPSRAGGSDADVPHAGGADADVGAVRDSLVRTLHRFSEQAERCEDPQRAREYLAAAREAAETLEALRR